MTRKEGAIWFEKVIKEAVESDPLGALRILLSNGYRLRRRKVMADSTDSKATVRSWLLRALADLEIMELEAASRTESSKENSDTIILKWKRR